MFVRELIALLQVKTDTSDLRELESRLFRVKTAIGAAAVAFGGAQLFDAAEQAARFDDARKIMEANGQSLDDLRAKAKGLYSDFDLVTNYNRAKQFGLAPVFDQMLLVADASAKVLGEKQSFMLDSITRGLARESSPILDNLAIIVKKRALNAQEVTLAQKEMAKAMGLSEDKVKFLDEAMRQGNKSVETARKVGATAGDTYDRLSNKLTDMRIAVGNLAGVMFSRLEPVVSRFADWLQSVGKNDDVKRIIDEMTTAFAVMARAIGMVAYPLNQFVSLLAKIPGSGYALVIALTGLFVARLWELAGTLMEVSPLLKVVVTTFGRLGLVGTLQAAGHASRAFLVMWAPVVASVAAIAIPALIAAAALEEILATFDPEKQGAMEEFAGRWNSLILKLAETPAETGWQKFILGMRTAITALISDVEWAMKELLSFAQVAASFMAGDLGGVISAASSIGHSGSNHLNRQSAAMVLADQVQQQALYGPRGVGLEGPMTEEQQGRWDRRDSPAQVQVVQNTTITGVSNEEIIEKIRRVQGEEAAKNLRQAMQDVETFRNAPER